MKDAEKMTLPEMIAAVRHEREQKAKAEAEAARQARATDESVFNGLLRWLGRDAHPREGLDLEGTMHNGNRTTLFHFHVKGGKVGVWDDTSHPVDHPEEHPYVSPIQAKIKIANILEDKKY